MTAKGHRRNLTTTGSRSAASSLLKQLMSSGWRWCGLTGSHESFRHASVQCHLETSRLSTGVRCDWSTRHGLV